MPTSDWSIPTGKAITGATYIKDTDDNIAATIEDLRDWCNNANGTYTDWTLTGLRTDFVDNSTAQTIGGVKTFSSTIVGTIDNATNLTGLTTTVSELNQLDGISPTLTAAELSILDGVTSTASELNILDGVTATTSELNILDGVTATAAEINILDGVTATTTELNYVDGVTSSIQTQIDSKASLVSGNLVADGGSGNPTNIIAGYFAFANSSGASYTTAIGNTALNDVTTGVGNTAIGANALDLVTTGASNTGVGRSSGTTLTTGSNNTVIGYAAQTLAADSSNSITLGNSSITSLRCNVTTISSLSDARDKSNIEDSDIGLDFINTLRTVEFDWNRRDGSMQNSGRQLGFIAQEVRDAIGDIESIKNKGLILDENPDRLEVGEAALIPVLVKAIQELSLEIEEMKKNA